MLLRNFVFATALTAAAVPAMADAPRTPAAETVEHQTPTQSAPDSSDATNYAEREKQAPQAADFQGGDMIVIGASGGVLLVLLCLLIIL